MDAVSIPLPQYLACWDYPHMLHTIQLLKKLGFDKQCCATYLGYDRHGIFYLGLHVTDTEVDEYSIELLIKTKWPSVSEKIKIIAANAWELSNSGY